MMNFRNIDFLSEKLKSFDNGKNHIFITGSVKVGKSTLLEHFIKNYYKNLKIDGVMTELVLKDKLYIELFRYNSDLRFIIGEKSINNKIKFFDEIFLKKSFEIFNDLKDNDILVFDEIGNKEIHLKEYCEKLISLFDRNRVFAVLKKRDNIVFQNLEKLDNYIIFDLDKFYE